MVEEKDLIDPIGFKNTRQVEQEKIRMYKEVNSLDELNKEPHLYVVLIVHFNGEQNFIKFYNREDFREGVRAIVRINHEDSSLSGDMVDLESSQVISQGMELSLNEEGEDNMPALIDAMHAIEKYFDDPDIYDPFDIEDYLVEI